MTPKPVDFTVAAASAARGAVTVHVPGDKSISHRALLFNALALREGGGLPRTERAGVRVTGLLESEDVGRTRAACEQLGVRIVREAGGADGGVGWWIAPVEPLRGALSIDCGNSGTTARLLVGALAGLRDGAGHPMPIAATLHGDASLSRRPMRRVLDPLRQMGARVEVGDAGTLPLTVIPAVLTGMDHTSKIASAQVKSAILLAGLSAQGPTRYTEPTASRDHTERFFAAMGADFVTEGLRSTVRPGALRPVDVEVPGDVSSAAFWMVAACLLEGAQLTLPAVGVNPTRTGAIDVLRSMGAELTVEERGGVEPLGDVRVRCAGLRGTTLSGALIPRLIDEIPVLAVAAAFAHGETVIRDAEELRVKESDRIATVVNGLRAMGAEAEATPDGMRIFGRGGAGMRAARIESHGDHRIAMAFAVAGLRTGMQVADVACVATSYPAFFDDLRRFQAQ